MDSTNFTRGAKKAQTSAKSLSGTMGQVGLAARAGAAGLAALAAAKAAKATVGSLINPAAALDTALQKTFKSQRDLTDLQRGAMRETALAVAKDVSASAAEVAEGFFFLNSAGLSVEQQIKALPQVAAFAQAGMFDLATATNLATDTQSAFRLTSDDAVKNLENLARVTDVLTAANDIANATSQQFAEAMTNKAAVAATQLGISIEETTAVLAVFANTNFAKGVKGGTAFEQVTRSMTNAWQANREALQAAGIDIFKDGAFQGIPNIMQDIEEHTAGMNAETVLASLSLLGFKGEAANATKSLIGWSDAMRKTKSELMDIKGVTQLVSENSLSPFDKSLQRLSAAWEAFATAIGTPLMDSGASPLINLVAAALEGLARAAQLVADTFETAKSEIRTFGKILEEIPGVNFGLAEADAQKLRETTAKYEAEMKAKAAAAAKAAKVAEETAAAAEKQKAAEDKAAAAAAAAAAEVEKQATAQKNLNTEVERFSQLTSSAAEGNSVEAYSRIFQTIAAGRQPNVQNQAQKAVAMVKNAAPAAGPAPAAGKEEAKLLNGIIDELRKNTKAVKQLNEDAEGI